MNQNPIGSKEEIEAHKIMAPAMNIFRDFHPNMKPVLWRILLIQLCLYRPLNKMRYVYTSTFYTSFEEFYKSFSYMYEIDSKQIEWKQISPKGTTNEVFSEVFGSRIRWGL